MSYNQDIIKVAAISQENVDSINSIQTLKCPVDTYFTISKNS